MYPRDLRQRLRARLEPEPAAVPAPGDRLAAVLIPVIDADEPSLVFTRRADGLPRHAGEISFPGGMVDPGDESVVMTALREAEEELGIAPASVEVLGATDPVHTSVSGILVVPVVGFLRQRPAFRPSAGEIAEVLEVSVAHLVEAESQIEWDTPGGRWRGWGYALEGRTIWGATGLMLHAFLAHLQAAERSGHPR
ncbi:MAG: CoA pyrophosphatase [Actinomycetota bacterium]